MSCFPASVFVVAIANGDLKKHLFVKGFLMGSIQTLRFGIVQETWEHWAVWHSILCVRVEASLVWRLNWFLTSFLFKFRDNFWIFSIPWQIIASKCRSSIVGTKQLLLRIFSQHSFLNGFSYFIQKLRFLQTANWSWINASFPIYTMKLLSSLSSGTWGCGNQ